MDPVTHTLVGASLAETRLGRMSAYAAPTLILGANAPDMDAVTMLIDRDLALGFRRGWTHGVLAIAVLPILLTALICLLDRAVARWRGTAPRARPDRLLLLAYIAVASHPLMDWLNTYGMRFLMPFDGRWFYGDALVLLDPLVWLLSGTAVVIAHSRSATGVAAWLALGGAMTLLLTLVAEVPAGTWVLWLAGLAAIAAVRASGVSPPRIQRMATLALIATGAYMLAMAGGSRLAAREVADWLTARGGTYQAIMAGPLPARPFARDIVVADRDHYHFLELNWLRTERIQVISPPLERVRGPAVEAALAAPQVQGARNWLRFPLYTVEQRPDGYRVTIRDARYTRRRGLAFPMGVVELDRELQPKLPAAGAAD
ncbi:MAG: metal-dependent hydrolase [Acidobacteriota bacterium]|nr:metal-dependent hydrolase [Acidobacteriota bacterium]MDE2962752.1 metal-dependent hydrolase [Acidobacteriota bacterium]